MQRTETILGFTNTFCHRAFRPSIYSLCIISLLFSIGAISSLLTPILSLTLLIFTISIASLGFFVIAKQNPLSQLSNLADYLVKKLVSLHGQKIS